MNILLGIYSPFFLQALCFPMDKSWGPSEFSSNIHPHQVGRYLNKIEFNQDMHGHNQRSPSSIANLHSNPGIYASVPNSVQTSSIHSTDTRNNRAPSLSLDLTLAPPGSVLGCSGKDVQNLDLSLAQPVILKLENSQNVHGPNLPKELSSDRAQDLFKLSSERTSTKIGDNQKLINNRSTYFSPKRCHGDMEGESSNAGGSNLPKFQKTQINQMSKNLEASILDHFWQKIGVGEPITSSSTENHLLNQLHHFGRELLLKEATLQNQIEAYFKNMEDFFLQKLKALKILLDDKVQIWQEMNNIINIYSKITLGFFASLKIVCQKDVGELKGLYEDGWMFLSQLFEDWKDSSLDYMVSLQSSYIKALSSDITVCTYRPKYSMPMKENGDPPILVYFSLFKKGSEVKNFRRYQEKSNLSLSDFVMAIDTGLDGQKGDTETEKTISTVPLKNTLPVQRGRKDEVARTMEIGKMITNNSLGRYINIWLGILENKMQARFDQKNLPSGIFYGNIRSVINRMRSHILPFFFGSLHILHPESPPDRGVDGVLSDGYIFVMEYFKGWEAPDLDTAITLPAPKISQYEYNPQASVLLRYLLNLLPDGSGRKSVHLLWGLWKAWIKWDQSSFKNKKQFTNCKTFFDTLRKVASE
ncbi:uncharacterized protein MELLADRAFT_59650 [Melampsora larici-populina 98AG31]|uniref:Uncharacterized protein n=1 Tax=Melampsora larici-populina (strain 98AG31 / pathotype 3-4-7) TaxID=747676 RepID=F4R8C2_MELLP|nr:uncharacterized protein MELLADRAFT_59650 [Melampsora larici-populina 98AG31]EGG11464.1 hypothetical protein MELLADRAFT_59650 [Melampsora larici-populina 98AG31]